MAIRYTPAMIIGTDRIILRDFTADDRTAFVGYQMDPRYRRLYDFGNDTSRASELFDLFASWRDEVPRFNYQFGVFDAATHRLCGCAGLRQRPDDRKTAVLGIELAPTDWGRYRVALDIATCLLDFGFDTLGLRMVVGDTASGNRRVEKLASWFGARIIDRRNGPGWMGARGWQEVDWALTRDEWNRSDQRRRATTVRTGRAEP